MSNSATPPSTQATAPSPGSLQSPLSDQANKLRQLLFTKDTATTFAQSFVLLGHVLKELAVLVWLALCWGIVAIAWVGRNAPEWHQSLRSRWQALQSTAETQTPGEIATEASKTLLTKSKTIFSTILTTAENQVGSVGDPSSPK